MRGFNVGIFAETQHQVKLISSICIFPEYLLYTGIDVNAIFRLTSCFVNEVLTSDRRIVGKARIKIAYDDCIAA
jgi:hypothetical protein